MHFACLALRVHSDAAVQGEQSANLHAAGFANGSGSGRQAAAGAGVGRCRLHQIRGMPRAKWLAISSKVVVRQNAQGLHLKNSAEAVMNVMLSTPCH